MAGETPEQQPPSRLSRARKGALRWMVGSMLGGYTFGTAAPSAKMNELIKRKLEPKERPEPPVV
jgi:hypothetical protein